MEMAISAIGLGIAPSIGMSFPRFFAFHRHLVMRPRPWSAEL